MISTRVAVIARSQAASAARWALLRRTPAGDARDGCLGVRGRGINRRGSRSRAQLCRVVAGRTRPPHRHSHRLGAAINPRGTQVANRAIKRAPKNLAAIWATRSAAGIRFEDVRGIFHNTHQGRNALMPTQTPGSHRNVIGSSGSRLSVCIPNLMRPAWAQVLRLLSLKRALVSSTD